MKISNSSAGGKGGRRRRAPPRSPHLRGKGAPPAPNAAPINWHLPSLYTGCLLGILFDNQSIRKPKADLWGGSGGVWSLHHLNGGVWGTQVSNFSNFPRNTIGHIFPASPTQCQGRTWRGSPARRLSSIHVCTISAQTPFLTMDHGSHI